MVSPSRTTVAAKALSCAGQVAQVPATEPLYARLDQLHLAAGAEDGYLYVETGDVPHRCRAPRTSSGLVS